MLSLVMASYGMMYNAADDVGHAGQFTALIRNSNLKSELQPTDWNFGNRPLSVLRRSPLDTNFIRFGRSGLPLDLQVESKRSEENDADTNRQAPKYFPSNYIRFGKKSDRRN